MHTVSVWRCKCGIRIKVVTDVDLDKPMQTVSVFCPTCHDEQILSGHTVLEFKNEELSMENGL
jgi:hypothetical protein